MTVRAEGVLYEQMTFSEAAMVAGPVNRSKVIHELEEPDVVNEAESVAG